MEPWTPFLVACVWPITVVIILFLKPIKSILGTLEERVRKGAAVTLPGGISLGPDVNTNNLPLPLSNGPSTAPPSGTLPNEEFQNIELATAVLRGRSLGNPPQRRGRGKHAWRSRQSFSREREGANSIEAAERNGDRWFHKAPP